MKTLIPGGPRERAIIFREAIASGRTVSVGYRKGGMLEIEDQTGKDLTLIRHGRWIHVGHPYHGRVFSPGHEPLVLLG
jgi:hypothetical protein